MNVRFISCDNGPNYSWDDIFVAATTLFRNKIKAQEKVVSFFKSTFNNDPIWFFDSGRSALTELLTAFDFPVGSEIIIQALSCIVVPNSISQAGYVPVVVDIDDSFNINPKLIEKTITTKTKAIIIQHNFGCPADVEAIQRICKKHNVLLIEDCAHSLGVTVEVKGVTEWAGSWGDAAIFSFGRDKCVSSTIGGAAIIRSKNTRTITHLEKAYQKLPTTSKKLEIKALLYPILVNGLVIPLYHLYIGKLLMVAFRKLHVLPAIYTIAEKKALISQLNQPKKLGLPLFPLLSNQIKKLDVFSAHRLSLSKLYIQDLQLPYKPSAYFRFPLLTSHLSTTKNSSILKKDILTKAKQQGIFLGQWYTDLFVDSIDARYVQPQQVPKAYMCTSQMLNLPTNTRTTFADARKIIAIIKSLI
jgi:dTDP-4-amino-4,6-dideoxygalactose transaminase